MNHWKVLTKLNKNLYIKAFYQFLCKNLKKRVLMEKRKPLLKKEKRKSADIVNFS